MPGLEEPGDEPVDPGHNAVAVAHQVREGGDEGDHTHEDRGESRGGLDHGANREPADTEPPDEHRTHHFHRP